MQSSSQTCQQTSREQRIRILTIGVGLAVLLSSVLPDLVGYGKLRPGTLQILGIIMGTFLCALSWLRERVNVKWLLAAGVALAATTLFAALLECAGVDTTGKLIEAQYWATGQLLGPPRIGIFRKDDPNYGWSHLPGTVGQHRTIDHDVQYTIDDEGCRRIPAPENPLGTIHMLGCSFTFGQGVADDECYPAVLASRYWKRYRVKNHGVMGYSTAQAYLQLQDIFKLPERPSLVAYGWISHHSQRNFRRKSQLQQTEESGVLTPIFDMEGDGLAFRGLVAADGGWDENRQLYETEVEVSVRLLVAMNELCREHQVPFVVVSLPTLRDKRNINDAVLGAASARGCTVFDAWEQRSDYFVHGAHPIPSWHAELARRLAEFPACRPFSTPSGD